MLFMNIYNIIIWVIIVIIIIGDGDNNDNGVVRVACIHVEMCFCRAGHWSGTALVVYHEVISVEGRGEIRGLVDGRVVWEGSVIGQGCVVRERGVVWKRCGVGKRGMVGKRSVVGKRGVVGEGCVVLDRRDDGRRQGQRGGWVGQRRVVSSWKSVAQSVDVALLGRLGLLFVGFLGGKSAHDDSGQKQNDSYELKCKKTSIIIIAHVCP
jgi:hypothetical protein